MIEIIAAVIYLPNERELKILEHFNDEILAGREKTKRSIKRDHGNPDPQLVSQ